MHVDKESKEKTKVGNGSRFAYRFGYSTDGEFFYCRELLCRNTSKNIKNSPIKLVSTRTVDHEKLTRVLNIVLGSLCHTLFPGRKIDFRVDPSYSVRKEKATGHCFYVTNQQRLIYTYFPIAPSILWKNKFTASLILGVARQMLIFVKRYPEFVTFVLSMEDEINKAVKLKTNEKSIKILEKIITFIEDNYHMKGQFYPLQDKKDFLLIQEATKKYSKVKNQLGYHTNKKLLK